MNIQQTIRKVLKEEVNKQLLNNIIRRLNNIDELIQQSTEWTFLYYKEKFLKDKGVDWFVETAIDGFYIDYISPIFEDWEDNLPVMSITDDEEDEIRTFFETLYYDKIAEYYENNIDK